MKTKKLIALMVVVAMMFAMVATVVACNPHEHSYTKANKDGTHHWMECPDDGEIDESTKSAHSYTLTDNGNGTHSKICTCGAVQDGTTANHSYTWNIDGDNHKKVCECGAIEAGTAGTHSYALTDNGNGTHSKICTCGDIEDGSTASHSYVEGKCECGAIEPHTHAYTEWDHDGNEHWKKCPDDGVIDETTRDTHSYTDGACACGDHSYTGAGTSADPYVILNAAGMVSLSTNVNAGTWASAVVELGADIDLAGIEWTPIGNATTKFTGSFDGKYHTISNMTISASNNYTGLFGYVGSKATIANLKMVGASITISEGPTAASSGVGILAGRIGLTKDSPTVVSNISVDSTSTITMAYSTSSASYGVGGLVGHLWYSVIRASHFSGTITGTTVAANAQCIGGIAGYINGGEDKGTGVYACIMDGSIEITSNSAAGQLRVGGLVGYGNQSDSRTYIAGSFYNGSIVVTSSVNQYVAGILGYENDAWARYSISIGSISAENCTVGRICAFSNNSTPSNNHYYSDAVIVGNEAGASDNGSTNTVGHELSWFYSRDNVYSLFNVFPSGHYVACNVTALTDYFSFSENALPTLAWETAE